jgi:hypothetical protein
MTTKIRILLPIMLVLVLNACAALPVYGSGDIITKSVEVYGFDRVDFNGTGKLLLTQGQEEALTITADDNLMKHINVEVRNGKLLIEHRESISPSQPIQIRLSVKDIVSLGIAGIVNAESEAILAERLEIHVSGLSTLKMSSLEARTLDVFLSGSTKFELTDAGQVTELEITSSGSNLFNAPKLQSHRADVSISGSGDAILWATDILNINIVGNGSVKYYGSPQVSQSGSGNVNISSLGNP